MPQSPAKPPRPESRSEQAAPNSVASLKNRLDTLAARVEGKSDSPRGQTQPTDARTRSALQKLSEQLGRGQASSRAQAPSAQHRTNDLDPNAQELLSRAQRPGGTSGAGGAPAAGGGLLNRVSGGGEDGDGGEGGDTGSAGDTGDTSSSSNTSGTNSSTESQSASPSSEAQSASPSSEAQSASPSSETQSASPASTSEDTSGLSGMTGSERTQSSPSADTQTSDDTKTDTQAAPNTAARTDTQTTPQAAPGAPSNTDPNAGTNAGTAPPPAPAPEQARDIPVPVSKPAFASSSAAPSSPTTAPSLQVGGAWNNQPGFNTNLDQRPEAPAPDLTVRDVLAGRPAPTVSAPTSVDLPPDTIAANPNSPLRAGGALNHMDLGQPPAPAAPPAPSNGGLVPGGAVNDLGPSQTPSLTSTMIGPQPLDSPDDRVYDGKVIGRDGAYNLSTNSLQDVHPFMPRDGVVTGPVLSVETNGMLTTAAQQAAQLQDLADRMHSPVIGVHNATVDTLHDLTQSAVDKVTSAYNPATHTLSDVISQLGPRTDIAYVAHSQGALVTSDALSQVAAQLGPQAIAHLNVITLAGAAQTYTNGPDYTHVVNTADPVPYTGLNNPQAVPGADARVIEFNQPIEPHNFTTYAPQAFGPKSAPTPTDPMDPAAVEAATTIPDLPQVPMTERPPADWNSPEMSD